MWITGPSSDDVPTSTISYIGPDGVLDSNSSKFEVFSDFFFLSFVYHTTSSPRVNPRRRVKMSVKLMKRDISRAADVTV